MRQFQALMAELKNMVMNHKLGENITPPPLMPQMQINGHRLCYVQMGVDTTSLSKSDPTPAVVFLHGFGGFFMDWPRVMMPVSKHVPVYALDFPGWGFSEPSPGAHKFEDEVQVLSEFINKLGLQRVILCGISYGAGVAWAAAASRLSKVERVVLLNPMPPHPMRHMDSMLYRSIFAMNSSRITSILLHKVMQKSQYKFICRESLLNDRLLDTFYLDLAFMVIKQPKIPLILRMHAHGAKHEDWNEWEHRLAGVQIPVTILQGLNDRIFSIDSAQYLQKLIPNSELFEVFRCGHAMVFDQHRKVSDYLISCVKPRTAAESDSEESQAI
jgi:pimeloyl-ACP methyl ester carboxylesterase